MSSFLYIIYRTHVSREPNGLNIVVQIQTGSLKSRLWSIPHYIYNNNTRYLHARSEISLFKTHLLTVNLQRALRTFESERFIVQNPRIYSVIWPVFVIYLAFNVAKNLWKNRRLCWQSVFPLTVVVSAIVVISVVELDSTSTNNSRRSVANWMTIRVPLNRNWTITTITICFI